MALVALAVVFAGFATTYYLWPITRATHFANGYPISPSVPFIVHVHAAAFSAWILLLVAQVSLVAVGRTMLHRRVGVMGAWFVPVLIVTGMMTGCPLFYGHPFGDIVVFTSLVTAGLVFRRRPDVHKRLMMLGTLGGLMPAAITRILGVAGRPLPMLALFSTLVLAPAVRDFWCGSRTRGLSLLVGLAILASIVVRPLIGMSPQWRAFAPWLVG